MNNLLTFLREQTRQDHHDLDHHPVLQRLLDTTLDRDGYARALRALYRPQYFLETSVEAGCRELGMDTGQLSAPRTDDLARDLTALGCSVPDVSEEIPLCAENVSVLMGQRYVLEGARKGSVIVARQLRGTLGDEVPMRYFRAADPEPNWQRFSGQLAESLPDIDPQAALHGARGMFHAFHRRLI